jgi:hypothetical protein
MWLLCTQPSIFQPISFAKAAALTDMQRNRKLDIIDQRFVPHRSTFESVLRYSQGLSGGVAVRQFEAARLRQTVTDCDRLLVLVVVL